VDCSIQIIDCIMSLSLALDRILKYQMMLSVEIATRRGRNYMASEASVLSHSHLLPDRDSVDKVSQRHPECRGPPIVLKYWQMTPNHINGIHHYRKPTLLFCLKALALSGVPCYTAGRVAVYMSRGQRPAGSLNKMHIGPINWLPYNINFINYTGIKNAPYDSNEITLNPKPPFLLINAMKLAYK